MICPKCNRSVQARAGERCPLCGFALHSFRRRLQNVYTISFGFFVSTLLYSILVYYLDTRGLNRPLQLPSAVPYILLVCAVLQLGIARRFGRPMAQLTSMQQVQGLFLTKLAIVEVAAVLGVLTYLLTGSLALFVAFLAVSWIGFVVVGVQMPHLVQRLSDLALEEQAAG